MECSRYYPLAGNGGYDVGHYDITGTYDPATDVWSATTVITATATADLYRFDLDFDGMTISSLVVDGKPAGWSRDGAELVVVPQHKVMSGDTITISATYPGVPKEFLLPLGDFTLRTGFMATDDGATWPGSLMWRPAGSRSTTTRGTRPHTTSTSPCRRALASWPTAS